MIDFNEPAIQHVLTMTNEELLKSLPEGTKYRMHGRHVRKVGDIANKGSRFILVANLYDEDGEYIGQGSLVNIAYMLLSNYAEIL